ncbi:MAG: right-handed parallel beta-helix repeat-containing protein [Planctomycetota bacterium]
MSSQEILSCFAGGIAIVSISSAVAGSSLHVDDDASAGGNGLGWSTAYRFLQDALADAAASGGIVTEIRVAQGTYLPDRDESNPEGAGPCFLPHGGQGCPDPVCEAAVCATLPTCCAIAWDEVCVAVALDVCTEARAGTFQLVDGVALLGGYAGVGAPDPDDRDVDLYETILSGDLAGNDQPDFVNHEENHWHIVTGSGTNETAMIDGFTITAGNANGPGFPPDLHAMGAGMFNDSGSPTVSRCRFVANWAGDAGAGMLNLWGSSPVVTDCLFEYNEVDPAVWPRTGGGMASSYDANAVVSDCVFRYNSAGDAGGMLCQDGSPTVTNCVFEFNTAAATNAGGMYILRSDATVTNCVFEFNEAPMNNGGGMYIWDGGSPTIVGCTFRGNTCNLWGAGVGNYLNTSPTIVGCRFIDNICANYCGGLGSEASAAVVINCLFTGNQGGSGAVEAWAANVTLLNCTITGNAGSLGGGAYCGNGSTVTIHNSIAWNNSGGQIVNDGSTVEVTYSDVAGGYPGPGNINADPACGSDGRPQPGSPCVDAGDGTAVPPGYPLDLDGNPRFVDDPCRADSGGGDPPFVDMGACEFQGISCDTNGDGSVGVNDFLTLLSTWGACPDSCPPSCPTDFDGDCEVGVTDFLTLLAHWG